MDKNKVRLLIVDDEADVRGSLKALLNAKGFANVDMASRPKEGLDKAIEGKYDVILLDMIMPEWSGWDFLDHLRERQVETRVIVVSAVGLPMMVSETLSKKYNSVDFISKTQIVAQIEGAIATALKRDPEIV